MIEHLKGREKAIEDLGFKPRDAEWIALVALHSGVFLRAQYGRFCKEAGSGSRVRVLRLVERLRLLQLAADGEIEDVGRVCRISSKKVYAALGAANIRHRRDAARSYLVRRLLSLDYVLDDLDRPWLPTEPEKVEAFEAVGIERTILPKRVYGSRRGGRTVRPFGWKMPVACSDGTARFVYVDTSGETQDELLSWGAEHTPLWSALQARGIRVEVAAISPSESRLELIGGALTDWRERGLRVGMTSALSAAQAEELVDAERALRVFDKRAMQRWGGLNGTIARTAELQRRREENGEAQAETDRMRPDEVSTRLSGLTRLEVSKC